MRTTKWRTLALAILPFHLAGLGWFAALFTERASRPHSRTER